MKKIVLLGLQTDPNLGDGLIAECTRRLVGRCLSELGIDSEYTIQPCDIRGLDFRKHLAVHSARISAIDKVNIPPEKGLGGLVLRGWCKVFPRSGIAVRRREKRAGLKAQLKAAALKRHEEYTRERDAMLDNAAFECSQNVLDKSTAAVIIVGGGLIKYGGHQHLARKLAYFLRRAEELGIPVMFNAVGVEGYDSGSEECMLLREILNLGCVKVVSTRDDIDTLRDKYIERPEIIVEKVPCPALWASEFFPIDRKSHQTGSKSLIGLGMARGNLFLDNGVNITPEALDGIWNNIIAELERRGYDWRVFTNGYHGDQHYAERFLKKRNDARKKSRHNRGVKDDSERLLPRPDSPEQLIEIITSFDGIIACRLHAAITAYSYGVPAAEPVWNVKQRMFGEWARVPERFISPDKRVADDKGTCTCEESIDAVKIVDALEKAIRNGYPECEMDRNKTYELLYSFIKEYIADRGEV